MSQYDQQHEVPSITTVSYPTPPISYPPPAAERYNGPYVMAPPPMGYPTRDVHHQDPAPTETTTRDGGFFTGCLAGLCCCCVLDCCF